MRAGSRAHDHPLARSRTRDLNRDPVDIRKVQAVALAPRFQLGGLEHLLGAIGIVAADGVAVMIQARLLAVEQREAEVITGGARKQLSSPPSRVTFSPRCLT